VNSGVRRVLIDLMCLMGLMALTLLGTPAAAQDLSSDSQDLRSGSNVGFEGSPVSRIDIAVRPSEDPAQVRALIRQEQGKPFSMDAIRSSVAALQQTGKFTQVQVSLEPQATGLRVLFILQPVYNVGLISFPGATKAFSYTRLLQAANVPSISSFVPDYVSDEEQRLLAFVVSEGFFAASIHAHTQTDDVHRLINIIFDCDLHARAKVSDVRVQGVSADQAAEVLKRLSRFWATLDGVSLKPGTTYSRGRIEKSLENLRAYFRKQGRLAPNVRAEPTYDSETNRAQLTLVVDPGPLVIIRIEGARVWKRTERKLIPIYQETAVDQDLVDEGTRNLVSYFQAKSYFDVKVTSELDKEADRITVVYKVDRGSRHRVSDLRFEGNKYFTQDQLAAHVIVAKGKYFNRGKFSEDLLKKSAASLTALYRNEGFTKATVTPEVAEHNTNIGVTFHIDEGPQDRVHNLKVVDRDNQPVRLKIGKRPLQLAVGKPYSPHLLQGDRNYVLAQYLNRGYPNVQFTSSVAAADGDPNGFDVVYKVDEGTQVKIGQVVLLGNEQTRPAFVRATTDPNVGEGKPLGEGKLLQSESDLYNLGIFDWASVAPVGAPDSQNVQQVLVRVHESKRNTMDVGGGLEVVPRSGNIPVGSVAVPGIPPVSLGDNFTVSQKSFIGPRGSLQLARRNIRGRAEIATLGLVGSRLDQRATFTYADPDLHGTSWSSLLSLSTERTTQNPIYTAFLQLAAFQVEKSLDRKHTKKIVSGYSYQRTDLSNILIPELVLPQDQRVRTSTVFIRYVRDTRDNPLDAHHGQYQTLNFGVTPTVFGSSSSFVRFFGQSSFYKPLRPWLTWANNFRLGLAAPFGSNGYVPLSERFFSGGLDSLRGFAINAAGPQRSVPVCSNPADTATCSLISVADGGLMLAIFNSEARFPIPLKKDLGGVIFYDGGNVYSNINAHQFVSNYSNSIGVGLRYNTRVGPIRVDVGRNLSPLPGLKATQYFVTLGQAF
jgi:outer membrane protein insertion porin family